MDQSALASSSKTEAKETTAVEKLDTRGWEAPEPILAILKKAGELPANAILEVRMDNQPMQLYDLLQQRGFFLIAEKQAEGCFVGKIRARTGASGH